MRPFPLFVAAALVSLALAGCMNEDESTAEGRARGFSVSVPEEVTHLRVDVTASSREEATVLIELEREDRSNLAEASIELDNGNDTRALEADVSGMNATWVLATVTGGDATVYISVFGVTASGETIVLRQESYFITQSVQAYTPPTPPDADDANATADNETSLNETSENETAQNETATNETSSS